MMAFDTLSERLKLVANSSLVLCRKKWGGNGLKKEEAIDARIGWRPTFYMKPGPVLMVAVEVADNIYPEALRGALDEIKSYDFPISVYQACSLDVFQKDPKLARVNTLRELGFGLITVDDGGIATFQAHASPLAQYISSARLERALKGLTPSLKVKFNSAHTTYQTNVGQGLQEAGQIIESLINCIVNQAEAANAVPIGTTAKDTAGKIDALYQSGAFHNYRAPLGGARNFAKIYRNIASHPAKGPKQAADKIRKCQEGFFQALALAGQLREVIQKVGYQVRVV